MDKNKQMVHMIPTLTLEAPLQSRTISMDRPATPAYTAPHLTLIDAKLIVFTSTRTGSGTMC